MGLANSMGRQETMLSCSLLARKMYFPNNVILSDFWVGWFVFNQRPNGNKKGSSEFHKKQPQMQSTVQFYESANRLFIIFFPPLPEEGSACTHVDKQMVLRTGADGPFLCLSSSPVQFRQKARYHVYQQVIGSFPSCSVNQFFLFDMEITLIQTQW